MSNIDTNKELVTFLSNNEASEESRKRFGTRFPEIKKAILKQLEDVEMGVRSMAYILPELKGKFRTKILDMVSSKKQRLDSSRKGMLATSTY